MIIALDIFLIIFYFFLFGLSHSLLASNRAKEWIGQRINKFYSFYRLIYNILSVLGLYFFIVISPKPDIIIFDLNYPFDIIIFVLQLISIAGFIWSISYLDLLEFIGIGQVKRWFLREFNSDNIYSNQPLIWKGPYKFSRHPIYFFSILFLGLRPEMDLFYLITFICISVYFYVGSVYEERKLVREFGDEYIRYINTVPRIFPLNF